MNIFSRIPKNIIFFYILSAVTNFWFISSNWIYFWTKYMTFGQLGWVDALGFGIALLLDVPTGAIADLLGKRNTLIIATSLSAIGTYFVASTHSFTQISIGWLITCCGITFYSGAAEALAYDSLAEIKREPDYQHVISKAHTIILITTAIATLLGGFIYSVNYRLPQYLWFGGYAIGIIVAFLLKEPKVDSYTFSFTTYFKQLFIGMKELFSPALRGYFPFFIVLLGVEFLYSWGFVRPALATSFGFYAKEQSIILTILTLISAVVIRFVPYFRKKLSDIKGLLMLTLLSAISFFAASFPLGQYGLIVMILMAIVGKLGYPWISIVVNHHISSEYRATTLSSISFITKIPYVVFAVIAGNAIQHGQLQLFSLGIGVLIVGGMIVSILLQMRKSKPPIFYRVR